MSRGYLSQGVYGLGGKCPGGKCPWGKCPWGKFEMELIIQLFYLFRNMYLLEK